MKMASTHNSKMKYFMIVFGCMFLQAIPYGLAQNVPPLFLSYLRQDFGFSLANVSLIFTIGMVVSSILSPAGGKLYSKFSIRTVMIGGMLVSVAGLYMNAFATQLWQFYLANAIVQTGCVIYSNLGVAYLIGTWFDEKEKVKALGIAFSGGSIGNFFLQPIFANLLATRAAGSVSGLHEVYFIGATASLITGLAVLLFIIRDNKDVSTTSVDAGNTQVPAMKGIGAAKTRQLKQFWLLSLGMFLVGINISAQSVQYANFFTEVGLGKLVGTAGMTFALACLVGNVGGGMLFAKIGISRAMFLGFFLQLGSAASMFALNFIQTPVLAYAWAALYGLSVYVYMSGPATMIQGLFGMKESNETLGIFNLFFGVGFALGSWLFGIVVDAASYVTAWGMVLGFIVLGFLLLLSMIRTIEKHDYANVQ